jgi:hypothetical protein
MRSEAVPATNSDQGCTGSDFEVRDSTAGAFTREGARQKAVLYLLCTTIENSGISGIVVIENGEVVDHVLADGGIYSSIQTLPDINQNGLNELTLESFGFQMGEAWTFSEIIEPNGTGLKSLGSVKIFDGPCAGGSNKSCPSTATRVYAKAGKKPEFWKEEFTDNSNNVWGQPTTLTPLELISDSSAFKRIH